MLLCCQAISLVDNVEYHFVTHEMMQSKIDDGQFIEHAVFSGNMYGTRSVTVTMTTSCLCAPTVANRQSKM